MRKAPQVIDSQSLVCALDGTRAHAFDVRRAETLTSEVNCSTLLHISSAANIWFTCGPKTLDLV